MRRKGFCGKNQATDEKKYFSCFSVIESDHCSGCGFCCSICPKNCLQITRNAAGFSIAVITDAQSCLNCGKCAKVCPEMREIQQPLHAPQCYAVWHKDPEIVKQSSSGGAFTAVAEAVINAGGFVVGVIMQNNQPQYKMAGTLPELAAMRGSKYLPADIQPIIKDMEEKLLEGKNVLLTTLPCLATAARNYFSAKPYQGKLYIADLICSGVPSPLYFSRELQGKKTQVETFRKKGAKNNWRKSHGLWSKDPRFNIPVQKSPFYNAFASGQILRNNCYECKHANLDRKSDITLADFWGEERFPEQLDAGISMLLVNSAPGQELFELASPALICHPSTWVNAAKKNPRLYFGINRNRDYFLRKNFLKNIEILPFWLLKVLYRGGCKLGIFGKLLYRLFWRKNAKHREQIQNLQQETFEQLIKFYSEDL